MSIYYELVSGNELAPDEKFMLGFKYDVQDDMRRIHSWCVLANTPHGTIPAKAIGDKAWYTYRGKVYMTDDFSYLKADPSAKVTVQEADSPPLGAIHGDLLDGKPSYMVICDTSSADEPGKSDGVISQFGWNGLEYDEEDFRYVCISGPYSFVQPSKNEEPKITDLMLGNEKWGYAKGPLWCVMTRSTHGWLPGLASRKHGTDTAYYTYGPKVCKTTDFHYIRPDDGYEAMLKAADSSPPKHGVVVGQGKHDNQPIYSVVCHVVDGDDIPGLYSGGDAAYYQIVFNHKELWLNPGSNSTMEANNLSYVVVVERGLDAKEDANKDKHCSED